MNAEIDISNVVLRTERLILRPWRESDLDDFFEYASVDGVGEMAGWSHHKTKEETQAILTAFISGKKTFAIECGGKVIGSLGIEKYDEEKIFAPDVNQKADAWLIQYRKFHDLWIKDNTLAAIRVCAVPASSSSSTTGG